MKRNFKKLTGLLSAFALGASLLAAGCGAPQSQNEAETTETAAVSESGTKEAESHSTARESDGQTDAVSAESAAEDAETQTEPSETDAESEEGPAADADAADAPVFSGLTFQEKTPLVYAECFSVYRYEGGYSFIDIPESGRFLVIPEDGAVPEDLDSDIVVLKKPVSRIYLAATSAMALFDAVDAVDAIRMSSLQKSGWYIDAAVEAMEAAFWSAERVTLVGSTIPTSIISTYSSLYASKP